MEQNNKEMDKIMSKIKKLKAQYEGAKAIGSENEAAVAAALLNKFLLQYNLSLDELDLSERPVDPMTHDEISGFEYKSIGGEWENRLTYVLCKYNLCRSYVYGGSYKRLIIVGRKENKELVKWFLGVLKRRYVEFSKEAYKRYKLTPEYAITRYSKDRFQRSYLLGCAEGLDAKLREEREATKRQEPELGTKITALVVQEDSALVEYVNKTWPKVGHRTGGHANCSTARAQGYEEGKRTQMAAPIASTSKANNVGLLK